MTRANSEMGRLLLSSILQTLSFFLCKYFDFCSLCKMLILVFYSIFVILVIVFSQRRIRVFSD